MKFFVINRGDERSQELTDYFRKQAIDKGLIEDGNAPDIVVSIGGDGTLLHAFHRFSNMLEHVYFVGIHTGHLGFFADWKANELDELLYRMTTTTELAPLAVQYPLAYVEVMTKERVYEYHALNEVTLKGAEVTLVARLDINDNLFEMFRGDGICISTPSGSTAYNKSLGGAIIHPSLPSIQIAEIASINNRVFRTLGSSLILPEHHHCDIYPREGQKILLAVDHLQFHHDDIISIRSCVSDRKVHFMRFRPFPFWNRVKEAFVGDVETN